MPQSEDPVQDELFHKLFRIFSYFAERNDGCELKEKEAHFLLDELLKQADRPNTSSSIACTASDTVSFRELLGLVDVIFPDRCVLEPLVDRLFERLVAQVIRKGFVLHRRASRSRSCLPSSSSASSTWMPSWCILSPGAIGIQPLHKKMTAEHRKTIILQRGALVAMDPSDGSGLFVWRVQSGEEEHTFAHFDRLQRDVFARDMALIIEYLTRSEMAEFDVRRAERNDGRAEREHALRVALQDENKRLAKVLENEHQMLRDEEIVRGLATRMLEEEKQKNEQMSELLTELQAKLEKRYEHCKKHELPRREIEEDDEEESLPPPPASTARDHEARGDDREHREERKALLMRERAETRDADDEMTVEEGEEHGVIWENTPYDPMMMSATSI